MALIRRLLSRREKDLDLSRIGDQELLELFAARLKSHDLNLDYANPPAEFPMAVTPDKPASTAESAQSAQADQPKKNFVRIVHKRPQPDSPDVPPDQRTVTEPRSALTEAIVYHNGVEIARAMVSMDGTPVEVPVPEGLTDFEVKFHHDGVKSPGEKAYVVVFQPRPHGLEAAGDDDDLMAKAAKVLLGRRKPPRIA